MKWSKQWVALVMLLPAIYLTSCGAGENSGDKQDEISTQSPPATDNTSFDTTSSSIRGGGTDEPGRINMGSTDATGNGGSDSGNTGMSSRSDQPTTMAEDSKMNGKKTPGVKTYNRSHSTPRKLASSGKKTTATFEERTTVPEQDKSSSTEIGRMADTVATKSRGLWDTTAKKMGEFGDTVARKMGKLADSAAKIFDEVSDSTFNRANAYADTSVNKMDSLSDNKPNHLHQMGDSSTFYRSNLMPADSTATSVIERKLYSTDSASLDSSRKISTIDSGINFTSSVFIPEQIRSNRAVIMMAQLAIDKSQHDEVKQVARTLENDHNALLRELQTMAGHSVSGSDSVSTSGNEMARKHIDMLKNLTGQEFDSQWLQHMHMMQDQKVRMFEQAETNNSIHDAELRIWVNKSLPILRKHREMLAQTLNSITR